MREFINTVKLELSKQIFKNQSSLRANLIDFFYSFSLKKNFEIIKGHVEIGNAEFDEKKSAFRGDSSPTKHLISKSYDENNIPEYLIKIIKDNKNLIERFLGKNFITDKAQFFRNYNIPDYLESHDIYSNIWHHDSAHGPKLLKIFVLLRDTNIDDGPFHFLDRKSTIKNWDRLRHRWSFENLREVKKYKEEQVLTGKKGDYIIISTSICMHRASIPKKSRDMVQITIYPKWAKRYHPGYDYLSTPV